MSNRRNARFSSAALCLPAFLVYVTVLVLEYRSFVSFVSFVPFVSFVSFVLFVRYELSLIGRIQMLRKRTGLPWSCKPIGPFAFDGW